MASTQEATRVVCQVALKAKLSKRRTFVERWKRNTWQTHLRELLNRSEDACEGRAAEGTFSIDGSKPCRPRRDLAGNGRLDVLRRRTFIADSTSCEDFHGACHRSVRAMRTRGQFVSKWPAVRSGDSRSNRRHEDFVDPTVSQGST